MEPWKLAARRYQQIVPEPVTAWHEFPRSQLLSWIKTDVCAAVEQYVERARFQEYAAWSIATFAEHSETEERCLVDRMSDQIRQVATVLAELLEFESVQELCRRRYPTQKRVAKETVDITESGASVVDRGFDESDELAFNHRRVQCLSSGARRQYVNVHDFFDPVPEFTQGADDQWIQKGDTIVSVNYRLHPVGEFVVRALFERAQPEVELLSEMSSICVSSDRTDSDDLTPLLTKLKEQQNELSSIWQELSERLLAGEEVRKRNSCVILTQIYAAFHINPKLNWLELPEEIIQRGKGIIKLRFDGLSSAEITERIAAALDDLGRLYNPEEESSLTALERAVQTKRLVLNRDTQEFYWEQSGPQRLTGQKWDYLCALALSAREMRDAVPSDVYDDEDKKDSTFPTGIHRLQKALPEGVLGLIKPGIQSRSYQLQLKRDEIAIL